MNEFRNISLIKRYSTINGNETIGLCEANTIGSDGGCKGVPAVLQGKIRDCVYGLLILNKGGGRFASWDALDGKCLWREVSLTENDNPAEAEAKLGDFDLAL